MVWDIDDPRLLACQFEMADSKPQDLAASFSALPKEQGSSRIVTLFCSPDNGLFEQDSQPVEQGGRECDSAYVGSSSLHSALGVAGLHPTNTPKTSELSLLMRSDADGPRDAPLLRLRAVGIPGQGRGDGGTEPAGSGGGQRDN